MFDACVAPLLIIAFFAVAAFAWAGFVALIVHLGTKREWDKIKKKPSP